MVKITALMVLKCNSEGLDPVILANASDLSSFGFFQRPSVKEFIVFVGRTVAKRTPLGQRQSIQHEEYKVHSYNQNGLCALGFMDDQYPVRSAFSLLNQILDEYQKNFGESWRTVQADSVQQWPYLSDALIKFQDPAEADKLLRIQRELDETKIILHKTIDSVSERGVQLDSLVSKSSDLSAASQMFYKQAKKNKSMLYDLVDWLDEGKRSWNHLTWGLFDLLLLDVKFKRVCVVLLHGHAELFGSLASMFHIVKRRIALA